MIAHLGGVPVEETLLTFATSAGVGLLLARSWVVTNVRRGRKEVPR